MLVSSADGVPALEGTLQENTSAYVSSGVDPIPSENQAPVLAEGQNHTVFLRNATTFPIEYTIGGAASEWGLYSLPAGETHRYSLSYLIGVRFNQNGEEKQYDLDPDAAVVFDPRADDRLPDLFPDDEHEFPTTVLGNLTEKTIVFDARSTSDANWERIALPSSELQTMDARQPLMVRFNVNGALREYKLEANPFLFMVEDGVPDLRSTTNEALQKLLVQNDEPAGATEMAPAPVPN